MEPPKRDGDYKHEALDPSKNEIRLLEIFPRRYVGAASQEIECRLIVRSLNDPELKYEALSYVWGDQSDPQSIFIDGQAFLAGQNLYRALHHLRYASKPRTVWIDALCIDQSNMTERGQQVNKMRYIYKSANHIVIWLGLDYQNSRLAFSLLNRLGRHIYDDSYVANILKDPASRDSLEAIVKLFFRPYWYRVWVVQEVNSNQDPRITVVCENNSIDWTTLGDVQTVLRKNHNSLLRNISAEEGRLKYLHDMIDQGGWRALQLPYTHLQKVPDLYTMLSLFYHKTATDPKDKVYALVGLSTAKDAPQYHVDYSLSMQQAYINATKYIVVSSGKLDIICSMPRGLNRFELPSWVADWTASETKSDVPCIDIPRQLNIFQNPQYCAAERSTADIELRDANRSLVTRGFRLGKVVSVGARCSENPIDDKTAGITALLDWFGLLSTTGEVTTTKASNFCRTILFDILAEVERFHTIGKLVETILSLLASSAEEYCPDTVVHPYLLDMKDRPKLITVANPPWIEDACYLAAFRRFFISSTNLMGMAPDSAEPGDIICVLLGCWMPAILRPVDGHYILLGGAYYEDYMYGKGMEELAEGKFELETFEIH
ncbi:hypothetical protein VTL71DRAFT_3579 [Oculimacula yallundae]|uniref:Heterokaryon incompatibility domain-containing protein n=1 Tax=Oculimacula yallundae TaxID=86028 RepID=A0ABR4C7P5_9HELO